MHFSLAEATAPDALLLHAGYLLLIASMLMTRIAWLRILAIGSGFLEGSYYLLTDDLNSLFWEAMFVLTNVAQLGIIAYRNRKAHFTPEELAFYDIVVPTLERWQARRLLRIGRWLEAAPGTVLSREGEVVRNLVFLLSGEVDITVGEEKVGHCGPGCFVGEISASTGGPATATAIARTPIRYLAFERIALMKTLKASNEIGQALELAFRHGLRDKLTRANQAMAAIVRPVTP
jgi:CRP-like cAMP-binding protein